MCLTINPFMTTIPHPCFYRVRTNKLPASVSSCGNIVTVNSTQRDMSTSEMIHHHGASLSKQQTADLLLCHGTQQDLSLSTV